MKHNWLIGLFLVCSFQLEAQITSSGISNIRKKKISTKAVHLQLDTLSIFPHTFIIMDVSEDNYLLDAVNATITWKNSPMQDSVMVTYRVFPYLLNKPAQHRNFEDVRNNFLLEKPILLRNQMQENEGILHLGNIQYNGSIGRGLTFGNSQNAVLNSNLNLQINGFIGDSIELTAAITDNNIPIQPDGNTQDLRDFDQIFFQVKKKGWQANFGDIDIRQRKNYFLNFYKRLQGASFISENKIGNHISNQLQLSGSVAKGKYNRNVLIPLEGNQGPYRLQGANNELFFVVLAGTERVFMDGELLARGEDQDYTINYNTAEVTFTPKRMVTKDKRIQVEFEYADRNYLNSNIFVSNAIDFNKKLQVSMAFFSNQDAKNSPINQTLDVKQKQFLADVGDGIDTAFYQQYSQDTFALGKILYRRIDTLDINGTHDSVFVFAAAPFPILYDVTFTYLGPGKGNYQLAGSAVNGKVFKWVSPDFNLRKQGDWEPVILLAAPKKNQIASFVADYSFNSNSKIKTEFAISKYDVNLFSSKNKGNDDAIAVKVQLKKDFPALKMFKRKYAIQSELGYEWVQASFRPVERLRNVEFKRDWSLPFDAPLADEMISSMHLSATQSSGNNLLVDLVTYKRSDGFTGWRPKLEANFESKHWKGSNVFSATAGQTSLEQSIYFRPSVDWSYSFAKKKLQAGASYLGEHNFIRNNTTDTLSALSFGFDVWKVFVGSSSNQDNKWTVGYFTRTDFLPLQKLLRRADRSQNINVTGELLQSENHQFKYNITWRSLEIINSAISKVKSDQSLLGRLEYSVNEWNGFLNGNVLYETGAGQEQRRTYTFIEVPAGQGEYTWIDYNNNGIKELNEFEVALFPDQRKYIRIFTPTNQFVKANYVQFNYNLNLTPQAIIGKDQKGRLMKLLSRTSASSSLQISKKEIATANFLFDPFFKLLADTTLLTLSTFMSNTFFFNRTHSKWGFDIGHIINSNKSLLTFGVEEIKQRKLTAKTRFNFNKHLIASISLKSGLNELSTPSFSNRNYRITQLQVEPSFSYINGTDFRATLSFVFSNRHNNMGFYENAKSHFISTEIKYNVPSKGVINARVSLNSLRYDYLPGGTTSSTVGYFLLDGLLPGKNYLWNIDYTRRIGKNIEISIQYDGRKPGNLRVVNIGRAAIRAIL